MKYCVKNQLLYLDCADDSYQLIPKPETMKPFMIAVFFSGLERSLATSAYNLRQDECKAAAFSLLAYAGLEYGKFVDTRLRDVPTPVFETYKDRCIPDAATICAITEDGRILLKREYRYACREELIELPAGQFELGEEPLEVAKRELLEETGYVSDQWKYLGSTRESTSKLTNSMHLFLAASCERVA